MSDVPARADVRARLASKLAEAALPVRRALARVALVNEERYFRDVAVDAVYAVLATQATKLAETVRGVEERVILRVDILMEELWRRTESVGARQATELQRLAARVTEVQHDSETRSVDLHRLALQMAEVHQLAGEVSEIRQLGPALLTPPGELPHARGTLAAELERGVRPAARERWEPYVKHVQGLSPVVALGRGTGAFLESAFEADVDAYAVDTEPAAVAAAGQGFDARREAPLAHLQTLADGSLGGAFLSMVTHPVTAQDLEVLVAEISRALQPDGAMVIEAPNPASFASFLQIPDHALGGPTRGLSPDQLAAVAQAAGLEIEECRYAPPPARHLRGVSTAQSDPALREIAEGLNELVGQLNDVLYGPQDFVVVARKPAPGG